MKWLMDVSDIMDEESEGKRFAVVFTLEFVHNLLVGIGVLVAAVAGDPVDQGWHDHSDVVGIELKLRVIFEASTFVKVGDIYEVPVRLEGVSLALDLVSECSAFDEGIVIL